MQTEEEEESKETSKNANISDLQTTTEVFLKFLKKIKKGRISKTRSQFFVTRQNSEFKDASPCCIPHHILHTTLQVRQDFTRRMVLHIYDEICS